MTTTETIKALRDALEQIKAGLSEKGPRVIAAEVLALTADASEDAPRQITYCEEEWITKTDWVQTDFQKDLFPLAYLGQHRADIMRDEIARLRRVIDHSVPVAEQSTSQSDGAPNNVRQVSVVATPAPYAYSYEIRQPFTDGKIWAEFIHRHEGKIPAEGDFIRNIKPLYLGAAASAAPTQQAAHAPEECEANQELSNGRADLSPPQVAGVAHAKLAEGAGHDAFETWLREPSGDAEWSTRNIWNAGYLAGQQAGAVDGGGHADHP